MTKHKHSIDIYVGKPENAFSYEDGVQTPVHTVKDAKTEVSERTGNPQVIFGSNVATADGDAEGRTFWLDLPIENSEASDQENAAYINKSGGNWLKFLQAVQPNEFKAWVSLKAEDGTWTYWTPGPGVGREMSFAERKAAAHMVSDKAMDFAQAIWDGKASVNSLQFRVYPKMGNSGKLFYNFNRADLAETEE